MKRDRYRASRIILLWVIGLLPAVLCVPAVGADLPRPNIVLIVADDLGWTDLGDFGSTYYQTPHLDRLCRQGVKFTAAYTCGPNCAPTRACLMSGLYSPRHGIYTVSSGARGEAKFRKLIPPDNKVTLGPSFVTVAETLKQGGYATGHFGKWHLGTTPESSPSAQGFEAEVQRSQRGSEDKYTAELVDHAVEFIARQRDRPFFLYLPFYAVHTPINARPETIDKYRPRKPVGGHRNPAYAAMLDNLDEGIGRVLDRLDALTLADRTVVIFTSDNGGVGGYRDAGIEGGKEITKQTPLKGGKGMLYEGGVRVPTIVRWPGVVAPGRVCAEPIISVDFHPTLARIAGLRPPTRTDGVSFLPLLERADARLDRDAIYWHFPGYLQAGEDIGTWRTTPAGAIRTGRWKLIEFFEDNRLELYDLAGDIGEQRNLANANPSKRDELHGKLVAWRKTVKAPMPRRKTGELKE
jgi:arylsulfatase A-like enzyme